MIGPNNGERTFIFLGHTYYWHADEKDRIDPILETVDYTRFDGVWLGGDICAASTRKRSTIIYLDSIFDLENENTLWAVGNHDILEGNINYITNATGRNLYYVHNQDDLVIVVINTAYVTEPIFESVKCEQSQNQMDMLYNVIDTIEDASHLILLTHHIFWIT